MNNTETEASLDGAVQDALRAAEPAAREALRALQQLKASDAQPNDVLERACLAAEASHSAIKAARAAHKVVQLEKFSSCKAAFASFLQRAHRYWRQPRAWNGPRKRKHQETLEPLASSTSRGKSSNEEDEQYVAWMRSGNIKIIGRDDVYFEPFWTSPDWPVGHLHVFAPAPGCELEEERWYFRFAPPSQDVLFKLAREGYFDDEQWIVVSMQCPLEDWGQPRWPLS